MKKKTTQEIASEKVKTEEEKIRDEALEDALDGDETENDIKNMKAIMASLSL